MRSNYKKLGQFITEINVRNKDLTVDLLLGVSIRKILIPSIANTVGTDMSRYKVVRKNQFAYGPVTSRNGEKISIALLEDYDSAIISQSYKVFMVRDEQKLDPEYLMMWFRRPEFDRYARLMSHGSTRETFDWSELCEIELPVPSIEKQQEIVTEYNVVKNRIALNEQLNQKLEETAQALYKHWFVDFEFPNELGNPYKSSGGAMVYNEELDKEIPEGWQVNKLRRVSAMIKRGITPKYTNIDGIMVVNQRCIRNNTVNLKMVRRHDLQIKEVPKEKILNKSDILINSTGTGTLGRVALIKKIREPITVDTHVTIVRPSNEIGKLYLWYNLSSRTEEIEYLGEGSTGQTELSRANLGEILILLPDLDLQQKFENLVLPLVDKTLAIDFIKPRLLKLQILLLSKMARVKMREQQKEML